MATAKFGTTTFPINPQQMSRTYSRPVARKNLLGISQRLESRERSLIKVDLNGVLTGGAAKTAMDALEADFENATPLLLITPSFTGGEMALLYETEFEIEQIYGYEQLIRYRLGFILIDEVGYPHWDLRVKDSLGAWMNLTAEGVMDLSVERSLGGSAPVFQFRMDNRDGQFAYDALDYNREVKIDLGDSGTTLKRRLLGFIDDIEYSTTKATGSVVTVTGRNYTAKLLEGAIYDGTFTDEYPTDIIRTIMAGTGIGYTTYVDEPNWSLWPGGDPWFIYLVFRNSTKLEVLQKLAEIYRMEFFIDNGERSGSPELIWREQKRVSAVTSDVAIGQPYVAVDIAEQFPVGTTITLVDSQSDVTTCHTTKVLLKFGNILFLLYPPTHAFSVERGAVVYSGGYTSDYLVKTKTWGEDIVRMNVKMSGIPIRTRVEVYGDGYYSIADVRESGLSPSGASNPGYNSSLYTKYGTRRHIIEDSSLVSQKAVDVLAGTELVRLELPEIEIELEVPGDQDLDMGNFFAFKDGGLTGLDGCYRITNLNDKQSSGGYLSLITLRRITETTPIHLLSGVLKSQAKYATGSNALNVTRTTFPLIGRIPVP